jgi:NAD(P)-dependent dehydrogenase (short-subunit alcohol dehydrogenase family)
VCEQIDPVPYPLATEEDLAETASLIEGLGRRALLRKADVRSGEQQRAVFSEGLAAFGHVDIVCANAGVILMGVDDGDQEAIFRLSVDVLLTGVWNTLQTVQEHLIERQRGSVIITASTTAFKHYSDGHAGLDGYGASKAGVLNLMQAYAVHLAPHNVRVNAIVPTGVATKMVVGNEAMAAMHAAHPKMRQAMDNLMPVRMVEPEDVSDAVAFLASEEAKWITGTALPIDAGCLIG